ncbi:MAG: hypothetical protein Q9226_008672 [Calogaya cf. arnoldii]
MDRLPQELINHVAFFIESEDDQSDTGLLMRKKTASRLPPYATLSRQWQLAIEYRTFHTLRLKSTDLSYFTQILTGHRRDCLSHLSYAVVLPTYTDNDCAKFEREEDQTRNNQAFTDAVYVLFQILHAWDTAAPAKKSRSLFLNISDIYSPMDGRHRDNYKEDRELSDSGKRHDLWYHRYEHSKLRLLGHSALPSLSRVSGFRNYTFDHRHLEPSSALQLTTKLPNLESLNLNLDDNEKKDPHARQQARHDFAMYLPTIPSHSLQEFLLKYHYKDPSNQHFSTPSALLPDTTPIDHLSRALHDLSRSSNLTTFRVFSIVTSPDLYWPENPSTPPLWPNLRQFDVQFRMVNPDGDWYFLPDRMRSPDSDESENSDDPNTSNDEENSDDDDISLDFYEEPFRPDPYNEREAARAIGDYPFRRFRTMPSDALMNPLLAAMARAAAHMPKLQIMSLQSTTRDPNAAGFSIYFYAAGQRSKLHTQSGDLDKPRLFWHVGAWRPDDEVLKIWREGREGLLIKFIQR